MKNVRKIYHMESTPNPTCEEAKADLAKTEERLRINEGSITQNKIKTGLLSGERDGFWEREKDLRKSIDELDNFGLKINQQIHEIESEMKASSCTLVFVLCPILSAKLLFLGIEFELNNLVMTPTLNEMAALHDRGVEKNSEIGTLKVALEKLETHSKNLKDRIILDNKIIQLHCKTFKSYKAKIKSKECKKIKEKINKLKEKYFKLSKKIFNNKFGMSGIKLNKLQQEIIKKSKPIIEEAIKKIGDLKRHVVGTEDEAQFFTIQSEVKSMLAKNIKDQSVVEDNLKNLLVKKEKTNKILKRTKKVLDNKIKQNIKLCK